jgi:hypothetical protein
MGLSEWIDTAQVQEADAVILLADSMQTMTKKVYSEFTSNNDYLRVLVLPFIALLITVARGFRLSSK